MAVLAPITTLAQRDLTPGIAVLGSAGLVLAMTVADLLDGSLGAWTTLGILMAAATVPLALARPHLWNAIFFPPLLLGIAMLLVAFFVPGAIVPDGIPATATPGGRALAGFVDRGVALAVAELVTLATIGLRYLGRE
ncbi:MAG: hypothetical protein QM597_09940 [Aeromicrobium sp.]|uniref:hypothetical protein n=1 Tax=Aeromicrobium sp. TaxID=1871063 RepID=UPI0039E3985D